MDVISYNDITKNERISQYFDSSLDILKLGWFKLKTNPLKMKEN